MKLFGGAGFAETIGVSEEKVNKTIGTYNNQSKNAMESLTEQLNKVLKSITDNWGTEDAVTYVTNTLVVEFQKLGESISRNIKSIGDVIKKTAESQAAATNNTISVDEPILPELGGLVNNVAAVLDNGYIGAYNVLEAEVTEAMTKLEETFNKKMETLREEISEDSSKAFTSENHSAVSIALDGYISALKTMLASSLAKVKESLIESTGNVTVVEKQIQTDSATSISSAPQA